MFRFPFGILFFFCCFSLTNCSSTRSEKSGALKHARIANREGKMIFTERRVPQYNQSILLKIQNRKQDKNRSAAKDTSSDVDLINRHNILDVAQKSVDDNLSDKNNREAAHRSPFVDLNDINFNGSKDLSRSKEVVLDKQNILSKNLKEKHRINDTDDRKVAKSIENKNKVKISNPANNRLPELVSMEQIGVGYFVQAGVYKQLSQINAVRKKVVSIVDCAVHRVYRNSGASYKLMIGPFSERNEANKVLSKLVNSGYYDVLVVKV
jgi:hypothetical protein